MSSPAMSELEALAQRVEARVVLCRRLHEHGMVSGRCDGRMAVCGFCDHTVRQQYEAAALHAHAESRR